MSRDLIVLALDQMEDDVGGKSSFSFFVAEPFPAGPVAALDHATLVFDGTVGAGMWYEGVFQGLLGAVVRLVIRLVFREREQHNRY